MKIVYALSAVSDAVASIEVERMVFMGCQGCPVCFGCRYKGRDEDANVFAELTTVTTVLRYAQEMRLVRGYGLPAKA